MLEQVAANFWRCPLCGAEALFWQHVLTRDYYRCQICDLIFVDLRQRVAPHRELQQYLQHQNAEDDEGYLIFQDQLLLPMQKYLTQPRRIMEFGSGPSPVFAHRLEKLGHHVSRFDIYFAADANVLSGQQRYEVITAIEVFEHLRDPGMTLQTWRRLLRPGGWLGVMSLIWQDRDDFTNWWYLRDPTHITFLTPKTIRFIGDQYGWLLVYQSARVVIWQN